MLPTELAKRCIEKYEFDQKDKGLDKAEFSYMVAELIGKYPVEKPCDKCLQKTRESI
jgi:hypothetical protein